MRIKILLILALFSAVFVSLTVGTLSNYMTASSFSTSILPDSDRIRQQFRAGQEKQHSVTEPAQAAKGPGEEENASRQISPPEKQAADTIPDQADVPDPEAAPDPDTKSIPRTADSPDTLQDTENLQTD